MFFRSLVTVGCFAVLTACASVQSPHSILTEDETANVKATVLDYFQGQGEASELRLNRAFAEDVAIMITARKSADGKASFQRSEMGEVISGWASNPNPPGTRTNYEFLSVNIVDDKLAAVTFRSTDKFFDALTLMKFDEAWHIVSKAYVPQVK